ncbi:MAG: hypothetical protein F6K19_30240 [Cyanothece sp. SIO1E1]|nr:hypothetical protein [Cyanothece sp. SIO1E1]
MLDFPPNGISDITDVFELPPFPQLTSANGVTLDTDGSIFNGGPGFSPLPYVTSQGSTKIPTGRTFSSASNTGYAGFASHTFNVDLEDIIDTYLSLHPDVANAVDAGFFRSGFQHDLMFGLAEDRAVFG